MCYHTQNRMQTFHKLFATFCKDLSTTKMTSSQTVSAPVGDPAVLSSSSVPATPQPVDGRKKPRTEAQIASTKRMQKARQERLVMGSEASPTNLAVADVWYSNHEQQKEKRRVKKMEDMENLITKRLDQYHEKIVGELQKPVSGFLDSYLASHWDFEEEEAEEESPPPAAKKKKKDTTTKEDDDEKTASSSSATAQVDALLSATPAAAAETSDTTPVHRKRGKQQLSADRNTGGSDVSAFSRFF